MRGVAAVQGLWQSLGNASLPEWSGVESKALAASVLIDRVTHLDLHSSYLQVEEQTKLVVAIAHCGNALAARWCSSLCGSNSSFFWLP